MARIDENSGDVIEQEDQLPIMNADVGVIVGTPIQKESGKWKAYILRSGLIISGVFKCDDALEKGDVVTVKLKDAAAARGTLKKIA